MTTPAFLQEISHAKSISYLKGLIEEFIQQTKGITSFSYFTSHYIELPSRPYMITHYPASWVNLYKQNKYIEIDPVVHDILTTGLPFFWDYNLYASRLNEQQTELFLNSADNGVKAGITFPLHSCSGEFGGVFFAIEKVEAFVSNSYNINQWDLLSLALIYHETARRLFTQKQSKNKRLTARETECLSWSARGKTAFEIGIILGLSEQTVQTYLKLCISKLEASNKTHAVIKAMMQGDLAYQIIDWSKSKLVT